MSTPAKIVAITAGAEDSLYALDSNGGLWALQDPALFDDPEEWRELQPPPSCQVPTDE